MFSRIFFFSLFLFLFLPNIAFAGNPDLPIRDDRYSAKYISQSIPDPVIIEAGSTRDVTFTFLNSGETTWQSQGAYLTAYTVNEKYRSSVFANSSWIDTTNPAKLLSSVAPGQTGTVTLSLTAPTTVGEYTEEFHLAANNYTWVDNSYFYVKVRVIPATNTAPPAGSSPTTVTEEASISASESISPQLRAERVSPVFISSRTLEAQGGAEQHIRIALRNISDTPLTDLRVVPVSASDAMFAHDTWKNGTVIADVEDLGPGALLKFDLAVYTPAKTGNYTLQVALADNDGMIDGSEFEIVTTVTGDAPRSFSPPKFAAIAAPMVYRFDTEPTIRVGLAKVEKGSMTFTSTDDTYHLVEDKGIVLELTKGTQATLSYSGGIYTYRDTSGTSYQSLHFLRLEPADNPHAAFTLGGGFDRDVTWKGRTDYETYRGAVELRMADDTDRTLYAINELPMEDYVAGVSEVSNTAPEAFLDAMAILARTYAFYIKGTHKYSNRYFDVVAHTGDQLYLGVGIEETTPNYATSVNNTRGDMVTYENDIVITPYFGNSDGKTRAFHEVWGGAVKPWLISVDAAYDLGRAKYGHGVGMSQRDAMARAEEEGIGYEALIKHYYTGVEIEQMYK